MARHAALPDAEDHRRIGRELVAGIKEDVAEATTRDDAYHHRRDQRGFIECMTQRGQSRAPPTAEKISRDQEARRVGEPIPMYPA